MNWFQKTLKSIKDLGGLPGQGYLIDNAEKRRNEDPRNFSIPRSEQRRSLKVGDSAKIALEATGGGRISGERPWVLVTEVQDGNYKVRIDNDLALFPSLNGATLTIGPEHIISVILPDEYVLPYSNTCLVSASVLQDAAWPHRLVRVPQAGDGDSGWRVFAENEVLADASQQVSCGTLISQYQVLDSVMDEPGLDCWIWGDHVYEFTRTGT
ncbi:hypothetical protein [Lysobacter sp. F60174L2]|uniref:hypothetical protein n=1 Tax=Lysobacter sp. F60174L2 TaxID=3459295 RepID=UPI00403DDD29